MAFDKKEVIGDNSGDPSQLKLAVTYLHRLKKLAFNPLTVGAVGLRNDINTIRTRANEGRYGSRFQDAAELSYEAFTRFYRTELNRLLDPIFRNVQVLAGVRNPGPPKQNWGLIRQYLKDEGLIFVPRLQTFATAPSNTSGRGPSDAIVAPVVFKRLTVDRFGDRIDLGLPVKITAKFISTEQTSGPQRKYREIVRYETGTARETLLDAGGVGEAFDYQLPNNGGGILRQSSFEINNQTLADPASLGDWKDDVGYGSARYELSDTLFYRPSVAELNGTPKSLIFKDNSTLYQVLNRGLELREEPILFGAAVNRISTSGRVVKIKVGTNDSAQVDFSGGSVAADDWTVLFPTLDKNLYLENLIGDGSLDDLRYSIETSGGSGGDQIAVDNCFLIRPFRLNGTWAWQLPDQIAAFLDDYFEINDQIDPLAPGLIANIIFDWIQEYLPTTGTATVTDPTVTFP